MATWKILLLPLAVLLPLLAYVAGTLSTGPEGPARPEPVILQDDSGESPAPREDRARRVGPDDVRGDDGRRGDDPGDRFGDNGSERDDEDDDDDDDPEVVLPAPTQLDQDGADDDDDDSVGGDD